LIGSNIAKRYARAFFEIAAEEKQYEQYDAEMRNFSSILRENKKLQEFLLNPIFGEADKKEVVETILKKIGVSKMTANFLKLLVDKRRMDILPEIQACYQEYMDEALKKVRVSVKTAFPLSAELSAGVKNSLEEITGKKVDITVEEDGSLLGGVVIGVGDTLYDGSIRTQLNNIRNLLVEER
jgi:F-type H+-transporting ATPase subunit delta